MWSEFELTEFPRIESVQIDKSVQQGIKLEIPVKTKNSTEIYYFISNSLGEITASGIQSVSDNQTIITLENEDVVNLQLGPNTLKIFAASDNVLRPYEFSTSFLVVESDSLLPEPTISNNSESMQNYDYTIFIIIIILAIIGLSIFLVKKKK